MSEGSGRHVDARQGMGVDGRLLRDPRRLPDGSVELAYAVS
jgi:hypothetical protein